MRKSLQLENLIPVFDLNTRWLLASAREKEDIDIHSIAPFGEAPVLPREKTLWDKNKKFRTASEIATRICQSLSDLGMKEF